MSHGARLTVYLVWLHLLLAAAGVVLFRANPIWLWPVEIVFVVSLLTGIALSRRMLGTLDVARGGALLIEDGEFTSRLRTVGQPIVDDLIALYNAMIDRLRDERVRLQEQHHFLSHILAVSPSGIVILDFDRRIVAVNPAAERLLERAASDIVGRRIDSVGSPLLDAVATLAERRSEVIAIAGARRVRCHHGTFIDRGFPRSFLLIEELTGELRQAERNAYEKLVRVMAHEVNNSVAASNSLLHSCLTYSRELGADNRADFEQALGIVIRRTEQLNTFMQRFAAVFRLPMPSKQPERVLDVVETDVRMLRAHPDAPAVAWDVDDPEVVVAMDRGQMEQVFLNVVRNAMEATGKAGTVTIRLRSRNACPTLVVEDDGPELSPEARANLFTPFFSTKPEGQGIGLTLVQEVLTAHGFAYSLDRETGGPTRFTIAFTQPAAG